MIAFLLGLFVGSIAGVFVTSLAVAAGSADEKMDFLENKDGRARDESNDQSPTE